MEKTGDTKRDIIAATVELAQQNGLENVTVKDICDSLGISKGTFYVYFHNIEEAIGRTYSYHEQRKARKLPEILLRYDDPMDQFWELAKMDIERHMQIGPRILGRVTMLNVNEDTLQVDGKLPTSFKAYVSLIGKMQQEKEIQNMTDPFLLFKILVSAVFGIDIRWSHSPDSFDYKRECYDTCRGLLLPVKAPSNY